MADWWKQNASWIISLLILSIIGLVFGFEVKAKADTALAMAEDNKCVAQDHQKFADEASKAINQATTSIQRDIAVMKRDIEYIQKALSSKSDLDRQLLEEVRKVRKNQSNSRMKDDY